MSGTILRNGFLPAVLMFASLLLAARGASAQESVRESLLPVGVSKVDITPRQPVHLINELGPEELAGVSQRLYARAIAFGSDRQGPAVLVSFDGIGVPGQVTEEVALRLRKRHAVPRERVVVCATHTHWAPHLSQLLPTIYGSFLPEEQQQRVDLYTDQLTDWIERAAVLALQDRQPRRLSWATGKVGFAANRRLEDGGRLVTGERLMFTYNPNAPVDHTLPVLYVHEPDGKLRSVLFSYACHNVSLTLRDFSGFRNLVHGDWAGLAQEKIEENHPGAIAIATIGCGGDQRPSPVGGVEVAAAQAREVATEVDALLATSVPKRTLASPPTGRLERIGLPLTEMPDRDTLQEFAAIQDRGRNSAARGFLAQQMLERLQRGERPDSRLPYVVQTWHFGNELAMVFMAGEVVVDYALRIRREFDGQRVWAVAYANATPCYIPSKRLLRRGGYEADTSMHYYGFLRRLTPQAEDLIIDSVQKQLPAAFYTRDKQSRYPQPKSPVEALAAMTTSAGLQIDLVAAEPLVQDPIAFDWGPDGRLWVVEMRDYPAGRDGRGEPGGRPDFAVDKPEVERTAITMDGAPGGRIKVLDDTDGDGEYDRASVFLDDLRYPTGVKVWRDGVLVACAPDILFARDSDGDSRADVRQVLYSGFGVSNTQHRVSLMRWGLDNWLHVAKGQGTHDVKSSQTGTTLDLGSRDLRVRPDTGEMASRNGATRFGHCRNDWGDWFGGGAQTGTWHYVLDDTYLQRNPHVLFPPARSSVSAAAVRVYPASASLPRFNRPELANHITSACGRTVYRDELFADHFGDCLFICEPAHNLVHRRKLERRGATFESRRMADESHCEFFAAADNWSRPVMIRTGPDGALWVADMYRFVIEHPWDIPARTKRRLDLLAGTELGRIYRIYPKGTVPRALPRLERLPTTELVQELRSPNGWRRDMAQQMLIWRSDARVISRLERMATDDATATARLHALCTLDGLAALRADVLLRALADPHPALRRHAIRLCESVVRDKPDADLADAVLRRSEDPDVQVRMQLAYSLGQWPSRRSARVLGDMLVASEDQPSLRAACLSSAAPYTETILQTFLAASEVSPAAVIDGLARTAVGHGNRRAVSLVMSWLGEQGMSDANQRARCFAVLAALLEASHGSLQTVSRLTSPSEVAALAALFDKAREVVGNPQQSVPERRAAVALLGYHAASLHQDLAALASLLGVHVPVELQLAAIRQLGRMRDASAGQLLLRHLVPALPAARARILDQLLMRPAWTSELLELASQDRRIAPLIGPADRRRLLHHSTISLRARASTLFAEKINQQRQQVVDQYHGQLAQLAGDVSRGRQVFQRHCSACHRFEGVGKAVGPDLATLTDRSADRILVAVLDPNRNVADKFVSYTATTDDGRVYFGMIGDQSATSLTLIGSQGQQHKLLREQIVELASTGVSLMPEGIEQSISAAQMADLTVFLQQDAPAAACH